MSQLYKEGLFQRFSSNTIQPVDFLLSIFEIDIPTSNTDTGELKMWYFERFDHCKSLVTYQDSYTETHRFDRPVRTWRLQIRSGRQTRLVRVLMNDYCLQGCGL